MNVFVHRYTLTPRQRLSAVARPGVREGALLRVGDGFADVHPWPELGDAPLEEQLALLARGETTPLTRASLRLAALDGAARRGGRSLFEGLTIPLSHWPGADPPPGFDTIKLKSAEHLPENLRIRIDFNATLTAEAFLALQLPRERIEFVEDPVPYDPEVWQMLRQRTGVRLALDRGNVGTSSPACPAAQQAASGGWDKLESLSPRFDVLVHKPALSPWPDYDGEIVVTSYMDHPVGQFGAAYVAATHRVSDRCGLFTHVLYETDPFLERVQSEGARLLPPEGTGIGFDDLLAALPWRRL